MTPSVRSVCMSGAQMWRGLFVESVTDISKWIKQLVLLLSLLRFKTVQKSLSFMTFTCQIDNCRIQYNQILPIETDIFPM